MLLGGGMPPFLTKQLGIGTKPRAKQFIDTDANQYVHIYYMCMCVCVRAYTHMHRLPFFQGLLITQLGNWKLLFCECRNNLMLHCQIFHGGVSKGIAICKSQTHQNR